MQSAFYMKKKLKPADVPVILEHYTKSVGIQFNGKNPWDIQVKDKSLYGDLMRRGSMALGEGYVNGLWSCERLDELFTRILKPNKTIDILQGFNVAARLRATAVRLGEKALNLQTRIRAHQVGRRHYDIDPRVYEAMLDKRRIYSCAYWQNATTLEKAQEDKLKLICEKLELKTGERLLDIGCGWGGLAKFATENYGVEVVGITISAQQENYAKQLVKGLPVKIYLADYRAIKIQQEKPFDKIVSVGMLEHVGRKNDRQLFNIMRNLLKDNGLALVQTIGTRETTDQIDPWIDNYIFPNGRLPSENRYVMDLKKNLSCKTGKILEKIMTLR